MGCEVISKERVGVINPMYDCQPAGAQFASIDQASREAATSDRAASAATPRSGPNGRASLVVSPLAPRSNCI